MNDATLKIWTDEERESHFDWWAAEELTHGQCDRIEDAFSQIDALRARVRELVGKINQQESELQHYKRELASSDDDDYELQGQNEDDEDDECPHCHGTGLGDCGGTGRGK